MILEHPMTKQFCENRVMTEYHTRKPYFMTDIDDVYPSCTQSAATSEEVWKKFELFLTPPNSPQRSVDCGDDQAPQLVPVAPSVTLSNFDFFTEFDLSESADINVPDSDELNDVVYAQLGMCPYDSDNQTLISDCMWNGVGYKASAALRKAHKSTTCPQSRTPCHANGCVDPRNIFPYPVGPSPAAIWQKTTDQQTPLPKRRAPVDGAETPSDSEEEIDVVTVEKGNNPASFKAKNAISPKIVATIVPKEDGKLAFVTNTGSSLSTKRLVQTIPKNSERDRGRPKSKYHLLTTTTTTNGQQKSRTVTTTLDQSKSASHIINKRHSVDSTQGLMKMANPKLVMQRGSDSTSPVARFDKRILSLEGVSFCATNKARQNSTTTDANDFVESQIEAGLLDQNDTSLAAEFNLADLKTTITPFEIKEETDANSNIKMQPPNKRRRKSETPAKTTPPGAATETEQIRAAHNVLERQRREGLRTSFLRLRDNVPELQRQEKTPKVHILNKARDYCLELQKTEKNLLAEKARLINLNKKLRDRLQQSTNLLHPLRHRESDVESDCEEAAIVSPMSIASSLPPSPAVFSTGGYYIARQVSQDITAPSQEVVLRLEPTVNPNCSSGSKVTDLVAALKQNTCQGEIRAFISPVRKSPDVTNSRGSTPSDAALSDGFECLSEEETAMP